MATTITNVLKREWFILVLIILPYLVVPFVWDQIPAEIPMHWNMQGEPDSFASKEWSVVLFPIGSLILYGLVLLVPWLDPKRRVEIDQKPLPEFRLFLPLMVTGLFLITVLSSIHTGFDQGFLIYLAVTLVLLIFGNYLRTLKPNYFIGIRTPWTLEDPENWRKTHHLASTLWTSVCLILLVVAFLVSTEVFGTIFFISVMIMALVPIGYSFYVFKKD